MGGLIMILVVAAGLVVGLWVMAERIETGKTEPNMGQHTRESTTPESWAEMLVAVGESMRWAARTYVVSMAVALIIAAWTGSASTGATVCAAMIAIGAAPLVLGVIRATTLLQPGGSESSQ